MYVKIHLAAFFGFKDKERRKAGGNTSIRTIRLHA